MIEHFFAGDLEKMPPCFREHYQRIIMEFEKKIQEEEKIENSDIMCKIKIQFKSLYKELRLEGISERYASAIFNQIVQFTEQRKECVEGLKSQKVAMLTKQFFLEEEDIIYILRQFQIPRSRTYEIIRTIVGFTLDYFQVSQ